MGTGGGKVGETQAPAAWELRNIGGVENSQIHEAGEVPNVNCQQLRNAVDKHTGGESGIVDLHAFDFVLNQQPAPAVMHCLAVREKFEIALNHAGKAIRL